MLKIASIMSYKYPIVGGAQMGDIAFLKSLSFHFSYDCHIYAEYKHKLRSSFGPVAFSTFSSADELRSMLRDLKPDLIWGALSYCSLAVKLAKEFNVPSIVYMHDHIYCRPSKLEEINWKLVTPVVYPSDQEVDFVLTQSDKVLVNSCYLQNRFKRKYGLRPQVIYNDFDRNEFFVRRSLISDEGYITCVNGVQPYKGLEMIIALAKAFKNEKFLIILPDLFHDKNFIKHLTILKAHGENITLAPFGPIKKYFRMSKILLVPSQWGEPFGRIAVEAMACGMPVLASRFGGLEEIVGNSSLGIRDFRRSMAWQKGLKLLLDSPQARALNIEQGKRLSEKYLNGRSVQDLNNLIKELIKNKKKTGVVNKTIALCGGTTQKSAYAHINAAWSGMAKKEKKYDIVNLKDPTDFSDHLIDCIIHHDYSKDFKKVTLPLEGKFIAVRTWDFGRYPTAWTKKIKAECDQLWVHTQWVKKQAVKSGIPRDRVKIVSHGVDEKIFKPMGSCYKLPTTKKFRFIFVGGTVERKGVDILLKAYKKAFSPKDDVSLVIKDNKSDELYKGITLRDRIIRMAKNKNNPEIIYIDEYFSSQDLAALYRSCQVGVFPYRAEGFAMPILESMACGRPCIVPDFGACLDFCNEANAFLMPVKRIYAPVGKSFSVNQLGFKEQIEEIDICEVLVDTLAEQMRKVYFLSEQEIELKAQESVRTVLGHFKWSDSLEQMKDHLRDLERYKIPIRFLSPKRDNFIRLKKRRVIDLALRMNLSNQMFNNSGCINRKY